MMKAYMNSEARNLISKMTAPDGYVVMELGTSLREEYTADQLNMLANDWQGYEILQITQGNGRKHRVIIMIKEA